MVFDGPGQGLFLLRLQIDKKDMLAGLQNPLEASEVHIAVVQTMKTTFPGGEANNNDGKKNKGEPPCCTLGKTQPIG